MHPYEVLMRPLLSEKSTDIREAASQYTFQVRPDASKADIKSAIEKLFDVKVTKVQTSITRGKRRRRGNQLAKRVPKIKKAMVSLTGEGKISIFEDL